MRWTALFDDLEGQCAAFARADRAADVAERTRIESGRLGLLDRLRAAGDVEVHVRMAGAADACGRVVRTGFDWFVLADRRGGHALIVVGAVVDLAVPRCASTPSERNGPTATDPPIGSVLRSLSAARAMVAVSCVDGTAVRGTFERVGRDFVDVAVRDDPADRRRARSGRSVIAVRTAAIALVRWSV